MKHINKPFDEVKLYGYFGLIIVTIAVYIIFWGSF